MIIHWIPCYDNKPISWTQPEADKIVIKHRGRELAVDFSDATIVEFELEAPVIDCIHRAWREGGVLHLAMPTFGRLAEGKTIDHGTEERITWR